jgi:PSP1 C-terminal conserved region
VASGLIVIEYFVRIGTWGDVVRCRAEGANPFTPGAIVRGNRVICRTGRGLEIGAVTACVEAECDHAGDFISADIGGVIVRKTTTEDELLLSRLEKHRRTAMQECRRELTAAGSSSVLLDVDQLFDAGTLIFYFLEAVEPAAEELVQQLAARYESRIRSRHFAKLVSEGCGPACGTKDAHGGGCSKACAVCVVGNRSATVIH